MFYKHSPIAILEREREGVGGNNYIFEKFGMFVFVFFFLQDQNSLIKKINKRIYLKQNILKHNK